MEEVLEIQEAQAPLQQEDPPIKKLYKGLYADKKYTKSYDEFVKQYSTPEAIDKLYTGLSSDGDYTKSKDEFQKQYFSETANPSKKKVASVDFGASYSSPELDSETPSTSEIPTVNDYGDGELIPNNPVDLSKKAFEYSKKTKQVERTSMGGNPIVETVDDKYAQGISKKILDDLEKEGIGKDFIGAISDLPDESFNDPNTSKEALVDLYKNNRIKFHQVVNEQKNRLAVRNGAAEKTNNNNAGVDDIDPTQMGIHVGNQYLGTTEEQNPRNFGELENVIAKKQAIIDESLPNNEEKAKARQRLKETYSSYINPTDPDLMAEYEQSPLKGKVDPTQYAGLKTLQLFEPEKYQQAVSMINADIEKQYTFTPSFENFQSPVAGSTKVTTSDSTLAAKNKGTLSSETIDQQIGKESILRQLTEVGRDNLVTKINSDQYELEKAFNSTDSPEEKEAIRQQYVLNQEQLNKVKETASQDKVNFPLTSKLQFDNQVKELTQDAGMGAVEYGTNRFVHGVGGGTESLEDMAVNLFGSDKDKALLGMKRLGEGKWFESKTYLPEDYKTTGSPVIMQASPALKEAAKKIMGDKKLNELSPDQKQKLTDLVADNQSQIETVTNPEAGKTKNFFSKSTLYSNAGFMGDIGAFMYKLGGAKSLGLSGKTAELATLYNDGYSAAYNQAVAEGSSPSDANQKGLVHGGVMLLAGTVSSKFDAVKDILGAGKSNISKEILGLGEAGWDAIVNKNKSTISKIASGVSDVAKSNAKMIGTYGVGVSIANDLADKGFFNKNISADEIAENVKHSAIDMAIGSVGVAGIGFISRAMKKPVTLKDKATIWEIGDNHEINKIRIDEAVQRNELTQAEGDAKKKVIDNINSLIAKVPTENSKGKPLSDEKRIDYLYNSLLKEKGKEAAKDLPDTQSEKAEHLALVADHANALIYEPKTDKQLQSRLSQIEKELTPEKKEDGTIVPINENIKKDLLAEQEAINNQIDFNERYEKISKPTVVEPINKSEIPKGEEAESEEMVNEAEPLQQPSSTVQNEGRIIKTDKGIMYGSYGNEAMVADKKVRLNKPGFYISDVSLNEGEQKGKGSGQEIYIKALKENGRLYSTSDVFPITEDALRVQSALEKKGLITIRNEKIDNVDFRVIEPTEKFLNENPETKIPIEAEVKEPTATEVNKESEGTEKTGKFETKARKIAEKIMNAQTPSWLKIDDADVKKNGIGEEEIKKALADATIKMGKLLDKGVEFKDAIKDAIKDLVSMLGEHRRDDIEKGFEKQYNEQLGEDNKTGVKKSVTDATRAENGLPKVEFPKMGTDLEELSAAKERIDSGEVNPQEMVNRILTDKTGYKSEADVFDMQYYAHQLERQSQQLFTELSEAKTPEEKLEVSGRILQLSDLIDAQTEAAQLAGNKWGKIGNAMQPVINDAGQIFRENKATIKEAFGGEVPKEFQDKMDAITKERDDAIAAKLKVEEELKQKMAVKGFEEIKKRAQKSQKNKETAEQLKKEEQDLIQQFKDAGKADPSAPKRSGAGLTDKHVIIIGKLALNYFKQGVNGIDALVDKIHDAVRDHISGITRKDIRDLIANYDPLTMERGVERLNKKADLLEDKAVPPSVKTKGGKFSPSEPTDFTKPSKVDKTFRSNTEWVKANQRVANAEFKMKILKRQAFESKKNYYQRALAWLGRLTRLSVLSGYTVLGKLAAAATIGSAVKRIPEQAIGGIYSQIFKGIAKKAPIEGFWNAKSEAKFYKEFFNPKKFGVNAWEILKSGSSKLGKRLGGAEYEHVPVLYLPTDLHQIIKDPPKRATFEASFRNGLIWAEKNGLDINDPLVINSLENAAYKRAMYEIFQEQNWLSKKFTSYKSSLEKAGNTGATGKFLVDFMIPVSTVPTNIVRRMTTTSPIGLIRGGKEVIQAYRKGIENLTPDEADHVMQQLKQGTLGTALWLIGWYGASNFGGLYSQFNPNKKREEGDKESDVMDIGGVMVPKPVQHALPLEVIQMAATARRIYDNYRENKNASVPEALYKAAMGSIGAGLEQIPVIETGVHGVMSFQDPVEAEKLKEDVSRRWKPQILRETGVIGKDDFKKSKEGKFLEENGLKLVDIHKEGVHPLDKDGNKIKVSDSQFDKLKEARVKYAQQEISEAMKGGLISWDLEGATKPLKDLTKTERRSWIMKVSTNANKEAIKEVFGEQPEPKDTPSWETKK